MTQADPAAHGFIPERLARIEPFIRENYIDTAKLPNAQLLVARGDDIVQFTHLGQARDGGRPVDETTLFRIASMTKPITSLAFMTLVEEGKVSLDTPVHRVLPEFARLGVYRTGGGAAPFATRPLERPMRMVDLLRHTSGLTYGFQNCTNVDAAYRARRLDDWFGDRDLDGLVAALGELPLEFSPGDAWNYSVSTDVLGAVVQRVAGKPLPEVFAERIFDPLGMEDTFFAVPPDKLDRLADCYTYTPDKGRVIYDRGADSRWSRMPNYVSGGGGLVSSTLDYYRFCRMCLNGGTMDGVRILSRKLMGLMTMNHLPGDGDLASMSRSLFSEETNAGVGFGLGFAVTKNVAATLIPGSVGEYYWGGMFSTAFFIDPVERLIMVFMTQLSPSSLYPIRRDIKTLLYAALA